jgi:para-aminobenzoate synthetase/4-amino-4-deoxychorismate lyase
VARSARATRSGNSSGVSGRAEFVELPIESSLSPTDALASAVGDERPFALVGDWAGGGALVGSEPLMAEDGSTEPFEVLDALPTVAASRSGRVGGGWVGYLGYGLGGLVERLPAPRCRPVAVPGSSMAFYDHVVRFDAVSGGCRFEALSFPHNRRRLEERFALWARRLTAPPTKGGAAVEAGEFHLMPHPGDHLDAVRRAVGHIVAGDVFQVNVCLRLEAALLGDPLALFCRAVPRLKPRYGAYLRSPSVSVASFSPELFLRRRGDAVLSSPIKGTVARSHALAYEAEQLLSSEKDRAENLMIVDLMRNDLGRVSRFGAVGVPELFRAEKHPGVWHLVSDVCCELAPGVSNAALLRATFPPGSVTGAPKVKAMQLISELEATGREVYTGAIGISSPLSGLELNVAIRTFEASSGRFWLGAGGGVVADSAPQGELAEVLQKATPLIDAIGSCLAPPASWAVPPARLAVASRDAAT